MRDQAESLRLRLKKLQEKTETKAIAVISGKGGVGKSNFSLNFALTLSKQGRNVLLFDMDIGMGNIDILLGQSSSYSIIDMFRTNVTIHDIIKKGPENLSFIAGGTGLTEIFNMDKEKVQYFIEQLQLVSQSYDYIIFDMGAGISEDRLQLLMAVDEIFIITTPEPTAITDAYATMKYIHLLEKNIPFYLLVNRTHSEKEGNETLSRLKNAAKKFLGKDVKILGVLPEDRAVSTAVIRQIPFVLFDPTAKASKAMLQVVERYITNQVDAEWKERSFNFFTKLRQYFLER
ncbi:flagellar biosynthesis protein FlhG [Thermolongibacillus altinsuensis]|jgi:flagellar biosynthesis protein FlhG|uniref:Flagellar biosynthesis protein FlhG n=1 Tax=Thermolongibacillus altinsuensis TaxID=575256 RepID=A0A4R1QF51_9BACL|nr:MinD/ParA family protein [Thermolongibacillus altinsuensis]TCL50391.1 flagellar biosynthesis protein FlhG [Thermolongibacillus altinsuensis]GMB08441.1 flagellum site-determining protein YlxH [Thermolongibacillus altinsuensis]